MKTFKFRVIAPKKTDWVEVEGTCDVDAVQSYHSERVSAYYDENSIRVTTYNEDGSRGESQSFAKFEMEDGSFLISRICTTGIHRKGGIYRKNWKPTTLADAAKVLGVEEEDLLGPWEMEEDY